MGPRSFRIRILGPKIWSAPTKTDLPYNFCFINIFLIMFHFGITTAFHVKACSACSEPKLNGKEKLVMKIKLVFCLGIFQHFFWILNSGSKWTHSNTVCTGFMDAFTDLPVLKAEKFNVIIIALKQLQTSARRDNNSQDKPPIRDWQGASSLFSSCYWDLLGPSSTESSTELLGPSSIWNPDPMDK